MARTKIFRQSHVDAAVAEAKRLGHLVRVHVCDAQHLYFIARPDGVTRYAYRYSVPKLHGNRTTRQDGKERKQPVTETSVGKPGITLTRAKEIAAQFNQYLRDGIDPRDKKKSAEREGATFGQAAQQWFEANKDDKSDGWLKNIKLMIGLPRQPKEDQEEKDRLVHLKPLMNMRLIDLAADPKKITDVLASLRSKHPDQAQRALGTCAQIFQYAMAGKLLPPGFKNPADWQETQRHLFKKVRRNGDRHYAAMPLLEVPKFIPELRQRQLRSVSALALEFLLLTATRTNEVLGMRWSEIDWENKVWIIPAERMKARNDHRVPLTDRVIEILKRRREYARGDYVFTGYSDEPLNDKALRFELYAMGYRGKATIHGFRSAFRDWCAISKMDFTASEFCLAHTVGSKVTRAYLRDDMLEERRKIMDAWADFCDSGTPRKLTLVA